MGRMHRAAMMGKAEEVAQCLAQGEYIDAIGIRHLSALMIAAQEGHFPTVELLLNAGADISLSPRNKRTALHLAASGGHLKVVQTLVAQGADVDARSRVGCTPAMEAAQFNRREVVAFLLEQGTNPSFQDGEGLTVTDWMAQGGVQGRCKRLFPEHIGTSPKAVANKTRNVRRLMAEGQSADEYAAKHGRHILVWGYGHDHFEDSEVKAWAHRVAEVLFNPDLLAQCEEEHLQGEALEDARRCRVRRARSAARRAKRNPETTP